MAPSLKEAFSAFKRGLKDYGKTETPCSSTSPIESSYEKADGTPRTSTSGSPSLNEDGQPMSKNQLRKHAKREDQKARHEINAAREHEVAERRRQQDAHAAREEPPELYARYGSLSVNQSQERKQEKWANITDVSSKNIGENIIFQARVHALRRMSAKLVFIVLRQQMSTIQGVLEEQPGSVTEHFVQWAEHLPVEAIVRVAGIVQNPQQKVKGSSVHDAEISIQELHVISTVTEPLAFDVYEATLSTQRPHDEDSQNQHISQRTRLANRIIDLRTPPSLAIFRINSGICNLFRSYLDSQGFIEIHTPKLQGGATESGSSVFQVEYFGRPAFLAQSPQLAKQMTIAADFQRVYEVGPVFRAENSNTHRHLTEYTGLDIEMALDEHYHEALELIDDTFKHIFAGVYQRFGKELDVVKTQFPHEDLIWLDQTVRLPFKDGVAMLRESGWTDENGNPPSEDEDLHTRDEIRLGQLIREKYHTDYFILDKFPASARPFYTMLDPQNNKVTNSFDIFLRGQEILTGGQRIHDAKTLEDRMAKQRIPPESMEDYLDGFRWGAPPHAGGGIGLERVVMLMLSLGNIRWASLFPRDPKSLPAKPPVVGLPHPEADTLRPMDEREPKEFPALEKLIANYGDASNTSWLDDRYRIWRHEDTGAAIGYVPMDQFAVIVGNPLCDKSQQQESFARSWNG